MRYGTHKAAGRQKHLQAELPRSLGTFQQHQPRYRDRHVQAVIDKMLGCGTPEAGYTTYLCPHCLEEKRVAFSCKSSFCLSCCKVYVDEWVAHIGRTLYEGVSYRHTVLTINWLRVSDTAERS